MGVLRGWRGRFWGRVSWLVFRWVYGNGVKVEGKVEEGWKGWDLRL